MAAQEAGSRSSSSPRTPPTSSRPAAASPGGGLLATKLAAPQVPRQLVPRPRLHELLNAGVRGHLTLVSAGPGWGKTMLAAAWIRSRDNDWPVAWVSLDADDNTATAFWTSVLAGVQRSDAAPLGHPLMDLAPPTPRNLEEFVRGLARGLEKLPQPLVLILDDFHHIRDRVCLDGVHWLLEHPTPLRLMVLTRSDPRLPLPRLRVSGDLTEVRTADLAFREPEAMALFRRADLDGLHSEQRRILFERTEGWAAGLRLAALFASQDGAEEHIDEFAGDVTPVGEYLMQEVLAAQPPEVSQFLLRTSIVERLSPDLANTLTDRTDGRRTLERLQQQNAFVVALGPRQAWFRYHALLGDLLRHQLALDEPDAVAPLHRRAAHWFSAHNMAVEAVRHAVYAQDWLLVGRLVVTQAAPRMVSSEAGTLGALLAQIPSSELSASAELATCAALLRFGTRDYATLPGATSRARELLAGRAPTSAGPTEAVLRILDLAAARVDGDMGAALAAACDVLDGLAGIGDDEMPAGAQMRMLAAGQRGVALLWLDELDEAEKWLSATQEEAGQAGLELAELNAVGHRALLKATQGHLQAAHSLAIAALDLAERRGWTMVAQNVPTYLALALVHLLRGDRDEAQHMVGLGLAAQQVDGEQVPLRALRLVQSRLMAARGQTDAARTALATISRERTDHEPPILRRWHEQARVEVELAAGDPKAALSAVGGANGQAGDVKGRLLAARAHLDLEEPLAAEKLLAPAREQVNLPGFDPDLAVEAWTLTALAADRLFTERLATQAMGHALALAAPDGIRQPFLAQAGTRLQVLLRRHRHDGAESSALAAELLDTMDRTQSTQPTDKLAPPLTARETTILSALATMQSNAEIAEDLVVTVNTVKAHTRSLYHKLGVANRREAVRRARESGLI